MPARTRKPTAAAVIAPEQYDFDLEAAVVDEETSEPFRFKWAGRVYSLPLLAALPITEQLRFEDMPINEQLVELLGEAEYEALTTTPGGPLNKPISAGRMRELLNGWLAHQGLTPGKSPDSSRSSASTAPLSRPTSRSGRRR